ncbi:MAG: hypothetical protein M1470_02495 [Bacteroidetes bacterium]|nr:hypothetical protein [Bacteroidota bacterium]MCL5738900.1 hypothetical protein [Bacteroidota bacterium]
MNKRYFTIGICLIGIHQGLRIMLFFGWQGRCRKKWLKNFEMKARRRLERIKDEKEKERLLNEHDWTYFKKFDALLD